MPRWIIIGEMGLVSNCLLWSSFSHRNGTQLFSRSLARSLSHPDTLHIFKFHKQLLINSNPLIAIMPSTFSNPHITRYRFCRCVDSLNNVFCIKIHKNKTTKKKLCRAYCVTWLLTIPSVFFFSLSHLLQSTIRSRIIEYNFHNIKFVNQKCEHKRKHNIS